MIVKFGQDLSYLTQYSQLEQKVFHTWTFIFVTTCALCNTAYALCTMRGVPEEEAFYHKTLSFFNSYLMPKS